LKVYFHPYTLKPLRSLGSLAVGSQLKPPRNGVLLQVDFGKNKIGFADCFPWPELGDLTLNEQLNLLKEGSLTPLTHQCFEFARADAEARFEKRSLFEGLTIPKSHALLTSTEDLSPQFLDQSADDGFLRIKLKCGSDLNKEIHHLKAITPNLKSLGIKLRLDFNHSLKNKDRLEFFLKSIPDTLRDIEFIEDPYPFSFKGWSEIQSRYSVELALDHFDPKMEIPSKLSEAISVWVIKPAVQDSAKMIKQAKKLGVSVVITSYLDHPLGQLSAAWVAAYTQSQPNSPLRECGLLSHTAYEPHLASRFLKSSGPQLLTPEGTGFGLDDFLASLHWELLMASHSLSVRLGHK
jgi:O-succinylbenzoate synthase